MAISDILFGKWYSVIELKNIIDKHLFIEDIHHELSDREACYDAKKFYDEILPIFQYARDCNASEVFYVDDTTKGNEFDGKIKLNGNIVDIECTKAISPDDAKEQRKVDEICKKQGYCFLPSVSEPLEEFRKKITDCIQRAIEKKIEKSQKQPGKYEGFHLILTLDDTNFKYCNRNDIYIGINSYYTLTEIKPFEKIILYWKTYTGYPEKIIEIIYKK